MAKWNGQKVAGASGVLFVVALLVSIFIAPLPPGFDEPPAKFLAYYVDHRSILLVQMIIGVLGNIPALVFAGGLWNFLRREEGEGGVFSGAAVFAFVFGGVLATVATCWPGAIAYLAGNGLDESLARNLTAVSILLSPGIFSALSTMSATSGLVVLRNSVVPKWIGWVGLLAALLQLVAIFSVAKSGLFGPFGFFGFTGLLSFSAYVGLLSVFFGLRAK